MEGGNVEHLNDITVNSRKKVKNGSSPKVAITWRDIVEEICLLQTQSLHKQKIHNGTN